jgi:hypothetical protein
METSSIGHLLWHLAATLRGLWILEYDRLLASLGAERPNVGVLSNLQTQAKTSALFGPDVHHISCMAKTKDNPKMGRPREFDETVGMWESRRDSQRAWEGWEAGIMALQAFHTLAFPWSAFRPAMLGERVRHPATKHLS